MAPADFARLTGTSIDQAEARMTRSRRHYEMMLPWLPERCAAFLDIGCGLGGIAAWIACHYGEAVAHLLDGGAEAEKWGGYRERGQPWASVHFAAELFARHCPGRRAVVWTPEQVARDGFGAERFDLVYSTCSWGHHYGVATYLQSVEAAMPPRAVLIIDLRLGEIGAAGEALLRERFALVNSAVAGKKYRRTIWSKP